MATRAENILLSLDVYNDTSKIPAGWTRVAQASDSGSGFFAAAYSNGSEIVVAFRGWNNAQPEDAVDVLRAYENGPFEQIRDAQNFVNQIRAGNPAAAISLTGHSLGGGLAAITAVRNNLLAETFAAIETVDAAFESMNGYKEKVLFVTLWKIAAAQFNTGITQAQLADYAGVHNSTVFGDIAAFNNRSTEGVDFIGQDTFLLPGLASGIHADDSVFGRWQGLTGDVWSSLVPVSADGTPFSVDFEAQLHALGFTALPMLFPQFEALTQALPRLVLQLTNDYLARDSQGLIPYRITYDALDKLALDHLIAAPAATTVLEALIADVQDLANAGAASSVRANTEINTGLLQIAVEQAAREALDNHAIASTAGVIADLGQFITADLGLGVGHAPEGARVLRDYATWVLGDAAGLGGAVAIAAAARAEVEARNGAGATISGTHAVNDLMFGGQGNDWANGGSGDDVLFGFAGNDRLGGGLGRDTLSGGAGGDTLIGAQGNDILIGGAGADRMAGGADGDTFVFDTLGTSLDRDVISDFNASADHLAFDNSAFTALGLGALAASNFFAGIAATDAAQRIIFNAVTGILLYDSDGNGAAAAIRIATLQGGSVLHAGDIFVI